MTVVKLLLTYGPHGILSVSLANVTERKLQSKHLAKLDLHIIVGVINHVKLLDAAHLPMLLKKNRISRFAVLLFVKDIPRLIAMRQRIMRGTNGGKPRGSHLCGER